MTETKKEGLFDKLYSASKDIIDAAKKPLVRNKVKRKLAAAYDDASAKINEAELKMQKGREDFENYNINAILEQKAIIKQAKDLQDSIRMEYTELFAKDMTFESD